MALQRAKYLDDYLAENGKTVGPLHGLPISLKDQFRIKVSIDYDVKRLSQYLSIYRV